MRKGASEIEKEGARVRARWTVMSPNPNIQGQGEFVDKMQEIFLLNSSLTHYDLLVHRESKLAEQGLPQKVEPNGIKKHKQKQHEEVVEVKDDSDKSDSEEEEHIHCANGCPISKANTLEEEYMILNAAHKNLKDKVCEDKKERDEEDKKMGGKITASKFRAQIRILKSSYAEAMTAMHEEITKKEQALSTVKLLKATIKAKEDTETIMEEKTGAAPEGGSNRKTEIETAVSQKTTSETVSEDTKSIWAEVTSKRKPARNEKEHVQTSGGGKNIQTHKTISTSYDCKKCSKSCLSQDDLRRHIYARHEALECHLCEETIDSRKELNQHKRNKHNITKLKTCKFFLSNSCLNNDECLYSHIKLTESEDLETTSEESQTVKQIPGNGEGR